MNQYYMPDVSRVQLGKYDNSSTRTQDRCILSGSLEATYCPYHTSVVMRWIRVHAAVMHPLLCTVAITDASLDSHTQRKEGGEIGGGVEGDTASIGPLQSSQNPKSESTVRSQDSESETRVGHRYYKSAQTALNNQQAKNAILSIKFSIHNWEFIVQNLQFRISIRIGIRCRMIINALGAGAGSPSWSLHSADGPGRSWTLRSGEIEGGGWPRAYSWPRRTPVWTLACLHILRRN